MFSSVFIFCVGGCTVGFEVSAVLAEVLVEALAEAFVGSFFVTPLAQPVKVVSRSSAVIKIVLTLFFFMVSSF